MRHPNPRRRTAAALRVFPALSKFNLDCIKSAPYLRRRVVASHHVIPFCFCRYLESVIKSLVFLNSGELDETVGLGWFLHHIGQRHRSFVKAPKKFGCPTAMAVDRKKQDFQKVRSARLAKTEKRVFRPIIWFR